MSISGGVFSLPVPADHGCTVFPYEGGSIHIADREISPLKYVTFAKDGNQIEILNKSSKTSEFLLLSGSSFNEPFFQHGPFVGSSREEVRKAFVDLSEGFFGEVEGFSHDGHYLDE
jgi:quercetin 2,3-dioxygenase